MARRGPRTAAVCVGMAVVACGTACSTPEPGSPLRLRVGPVTTGVDDRVSATLQGLPAGTPVTLGVGAVDAHGVHWSAQAPFRVGDGGALTATGPNPATLPTGSAGSLPVAPQAGGDPTLLVAAMQPPPGSDADAYYWPLTGATLNWTVTAPDASGTATTTTQRRLSPAGRRVVELSVAADGVAGVYEAVPDGARHPAALVLGGSEGGDPSLEAAALAARGVPSLAQAYFRAPGLPDRLSRIPLETFDEGLAYLRAQPEVDPARIWVVGASRGSEAALLEGSRRPDVVHGVVALSPSSVVGGAYPADGSSAWTLGGKDLPYTRFANTPDPPDVPESVIPVEEIAGPVVTVCGGADTVWASCTYAAAIAQRLERAGSTHPHEAFAYPDAGHHVDILVPFLPMPAAGYVDGTSPLADELAREAVWPEVVRAVTTS